MRYALALSCLLGAVIPVYAQPPASAPSGLVDKLPHLLIDVNKKQVRVECEAVVVDAPLEFFLCMTNTNEHETVLRSDVKPSHLHQGLLMIGLKPGEPVKYSEAAKKWFPPKGPPLQITCEWEKDGKTISVPAYRMMRDIKSKKEMPALTWVFTGSRTLEDGTYAADTTGYLVSIVNFDLTVIDIPELASSANETLEWQVSPDNTPKRGTKVWMVIEPAGKVEAPKEVETGNPPKAEATTGPAGHLSGVQMDEAEVNRLKQVWQKAVTPHADALRQAAQTHYEVIESLRKEQNRLIDEADRIQRVIDELQKQYQDMTTPRPEPVKP